MTDPLGELRRLREQALDRITGDSPADEYERRAINMVWQDMTGERATGRLTVVVENARRLEARFTSVLEDAVQRAATKMAVARRTNRWDIRTLHHKWIEETPLVPTVVGNQVTFEIPTPLLSGPDGDTTWTELGLLDLCESLPSSRADGRALVGILSSAVTVRSAVQDLLTPSIDDVLHFGLERVGGKKPVTAVLAPEQRTELRTELSATQDVKREETVTGHLDGMRVHRRMFFLEVEHRGDVIGAVEPSQSDAVLSLVDQQVEARIEVHTTVDKAGRRGRDRYLLVGIRPMDEVQLPADG